MAKNKTQEFKIEKTKIAYYRKIYIAYMISTDKHNLNTLQELTGMPRPTIVTALSGLTDIGIEHEFIQIDGLRNRHGYYKITNWGDHSRKWIKDNLHYVMDILHS